MVTYTKGFNIRYVIDLETLKVTQPDGWKVILIKK